MNEFIRGATPARLAPRSVAPCTRSSTSPPPKGGQRLPLVAKAAACAGVRARLGLDDAGVDYVLIGGLAVGAHGFPRATKDLDIVPAPDAANLDRLATLLRRVGAQHHGLGDFDAFRSA